MGTLHPEFRKHLKKHPAAKEYEFLFECCRAAFSGNNVSYPEDIRPKIFLEIVQRHKLIPQLYPILKSHCENLPNEVLQEFRNLLNRHNLHILKLSGELIRLSELFAEHDIPWLSIKGPALAVQLYGDVAARQSGDLDILVKREDLDRAIKLISDAGYVPVIDHDKFNKSQINFIRKCYKDETFRHITNNVFVELHWSLENEQTSPLNQVELFETSATICIGNKSIYTLPDIPNLLYLCAHGHRHGWYRLFWLWDVATILKNTTQEQSEVIVESAKKYQCMKAMGQAIALSASVFSVKPPAGLSCIPVTKSITWLACWYITKKDPMNLLNFPIRLWYASKIFTPQFFILYYWERMLLLLLRKYKKTG